MLILTRRIGEKIFINGDEIKVSVLNVVGNKVRLGISASENITINRQEIIIRKYGKKLFLKKKITNQRSKL